MEKSSLKLNFTLKSEKSSYDFTLIKKDEELDFKIEDLKDFPSKLYQLKIQFKDIKTLDENFSIFNNADRFINTIKRSIQAEKYSISHIEEENVVIFEIKNEIFEDGGAKIKIPEQEPDTKAQVDSLTKIVAELRKELQEIKNKEAEKDEAALKSFQSSSFLKDEDKKTISKWIHPKKVIRFNLLFSSDRDGDSSAKFHQCCDGVFPTVTVILSSDRRFGGYSTQNWAPSPAGGNYTRAPGSFIFNLSQNKKCELIDQLSINAINRNTSYGPYFGGNPDLYLCNSCKSNNSSCSKGSCYNTGNTDILGGNGTNFTVTTYEVYQVIFE